MSPVSYYESEVEFESEKAFDDSFEFKGKKAGTEQANEVLSHLINTKNVKDETIIESCLRIPSFAANVSSSICFGLLHRVKNTKHADLQNLTFQKEEEKELRKCPCRLQY